MFSPVAVQDIAFPSTRATLDGVGDFFNAQAAYNNLRDTDSATTQSITGANSAIIAPIWEPGGKVLLARDGAGSYQIFDTNTNTFQSVTQANNGGRAGCYDPTTNSWIVVGYNNIKKIPVNDTGSTVTCSYPTNGGTTQYSSAIAYNGLVYSAPFVGMNSAASLLIYDPVTNTATTASGALNGSAERLGGAIGGDGALYFGAGTATTLLRYVPETNSATTIAAGGSNGYGGILSLPNGNIFWGDFSTGQYYEYSWERKTVRIITFTPPTNPGRWAKMTLGSEGNVLIINSRGQTIGGRPVCTIYKYSYLDSSFTLSPWRLPASNTTGDRQYQGIIAMPDGRALGCAGQGGIMSYFNIRGYNANLLSNQSQASGFKPNPF